MTVVAAQIRLRAGRPAGWLAALAVLAYAMLPALFAAHVHAAHAGELAVRTADTHKPAPHAPHSGGPAHCDLCRMLGTTAGNAGVPGPTVSFSSDQPVPIGRVDGQDRPLVGRLLPVALCPRGPPVR